MSLTPFTAYVIKKLDLFSEASGADSLMSPRYICIYILFVCFFFLLGPGIVFVLAWA